MPVNEEDYNKFIKDLEIINMVFPAASWKLHQVPSRRTKIQNEIGLEILPPLISPEKERVVIQARVKIEGKTRKTKKLFFEISVLQHLIIKVNPDSFSEEILKVYIQRNALLNLISVFREKIKDISFQMGIPPFVLPALKIPAKDKTETSKKEPDSDKS